MCQTRTRGLKEEEVSPLWHFAVTANAVFARWPVMDREAIQYTSFVVPYPGLDSPSYLPSVAIR